MFPALLFKKGHFLLKIVFHNVQILPDSLSGKNGESEKSSRGGKGERTTGCPLRVVILGISVQQQRPSKAKRNGGTAYWLYWGLIAVNHPVIGFSSLKFGDADSVYTT